MSAELDPLRNRALSGLIWTVLITTVALFSIFGLSESAKGAEIKVLDTGSMRGWLPKGGATYPLVHVPFGEIKVGDIVVYRSTSGRLYVNGKPYCGPVCHKVIEVKYGHVWTKGVSNTRPDPEYVTPLNYMGEVVRKGSS